MFEVDRKRRAAHQGGKVRLPLNAAFVQVVTRQRGTFAVARPRVQPRHFPALHRATRRHGQLVADQPATQADQDRCPCRASRPYHRLSAGRGCGHWRHGPRYPRRDPPTTSAAVMCVMLNLPETTRKRQDRSVTRAEKRCLPTRMRRVHCLICRHSGVLAHADAARGAKRFISRQNPGHLALPTARYLENVG